MIALGHVEFLYYIYIYTVVAIVGYRFLGDHITFQGFAPLSLLGGPIALQCFLHISDKSASASLQWFSTILTVTHVENTCFP